MLENVVFFCVCAENVLLWFHIKLDFLLPLDNFEHAIRSVILQVVKLEASKWNDLQKLGCAATSATRSQQSRAVFLCDVDAPVVSCHRTEAHLYQRNAYIMCEVRAQPDVFVLYWVIVCSLLGHRSQRYDLGRRTSRSRILDTSVGQSVLLRTCLALVFTVRAVLLYVSRRLKFDLPI